MNKSKFALVAVLSFAAASAFAAGPAAGGFSNINVNTSISGSVTASGNGFSESQATDSETAAGSIAAVATNAPTSIAGQNVPTQTAGTVGTVNTSSASTAWNSSTGNANGSAKVVGGEGAIVSGTNAIPGVASGSGYAGVGSTEAITAGTNEGGYTGSIESANFGSTQTYSAISANGTSSAGVTSVLAGGATVNDVSGVETVNGAALATPSTLSIGDSGTFTAIGTGSTGVNSNASIGE